jgi:hypothetical protein
MGQAADRLRADKWSQGAVLTASSNTRTLSYCIDRKPDFIESMGRLVVISQDCDILLEETKEPFIDLIAATMKDKEDGIFSRTRNPRVLHIPYAGKALAFTIHDKFRVRKEDFILCAKKDECPLETQNMSVLRRWLSRRYIRPPFPDAFNDRLRIAERKLEKYFKDDLAKRITMILFRMDDRELSADAPYGLDIKIGLQDGTADKEKDEIESRLVEALTVPGITVKRILLLSEDYITVRDLRLYKEFNCDYRSLPESPEIGLPPTGISGLNER